MKSVLAICDKDRNYSDLLSENLCKRGSFPFEPCVFESTDDLLRGMGKAKLELYLISENVYEEICEKDDSFTEKKNVIILYGGGKYKGIHPTIWKYESATEIKKEILAAVSLMDEIKVSDFGEKNSRSRMIGFFPISLRERQTSAAISYASMVAKKGKTLLISMQPFSIVSEYLEKTDKDLSDLIYFLRNGKEKFLCNLESIIVSKENIDFIPPVRSFLDLKMINESDWKLLINCVSEFCSYEYVILDFSEMQDGITDLMRQCEVIYSIMDEGNKSQKIINEYHELMNSLNYEDLNDKLVVCYGEKSFSKPERFQEFRKYESLFDV